MCGLCESGQSSNSNNFNQVNNQFKNKKRNTYLDSFDIEETTQKFNENILKDDIQDLLEKKYNLNDTVFKSIREEEKKILINFYLSKKEDFKNNMTLYLKNQNLNFITMLTKQIIMNEGGRNILEQKIKDEIQDIYNNEDHTKIGNLTVMVIGQTGTGKSCLINNILYNGEEKAKEGDYDRVTTKRKIYHSDNVPYINLVDTIGIELSDEYDVTAVGFNAENFIQHQRKENNINDLIHCIWYCVTSSRFQPKEKELVNKLIDTAGSTKIPLIIVLTKSVDVRKSESMKKNFKKDNFKDVIDVIAKPIDSQNGMKIPSYGLDKLIQKTLEKCKAASEMEMKQVMIRNFKDEIKNKLFSENANNKQLIKYKMMQDTLKNEIYKQNFENYINSIYNYHVFYFLTQNKLSSSSSSLIKESDFNRHKNNFFYHCHEYENQIIKKELPFLSNKFLDIQATKEKEKNYSVEINNKRNYTDFMNTSEKFLIDNFNVYSFKIYIYFVISNIIGVLSKNFEQELNLIVEELMSKYEIENALSELFFKKFSDFEKRIVKKSSFNRPVNRFYDLILIFYLLLE